VRHFGRGGNLGQADPRCETRRAALDAAPIGASGGRESDTIHRAEKETRIWNWRRFTRSPRTLKEKTGNEVLGYAIAEDIHGDSVPLAVEADDRDSANQDEPLKEAERAIVGIGQTQTVARHGNCTHGGGPLGRGTRRTPRAATAAGGSATGRTTACRETGKRVGVTTPRLLSGSISCCRGRDSTDTCDGHGTAAQGMTTLRLVHSSNRPVTATTSPETETVAVQNREVRR
jgi:hypothetical protein